MKTALQGRVELLLKIVKKGGMYAQGSSDGNRGARQVDANKIFG